MTAPSLRAFVNEHPVTVPTGGTARDAVRIFDVVLADRLSTGTATLTDGRGIQLDPDAPLRGGAIIRVVIPARRNGDEGLDADA